MKKYKIFLISMILFFIFFLIYYPHFSNPFPLHIDEWHHITEAIRLKNKEYSAGSIGYRVGFHIFLLCLSFFFDLVLAYKFFPAIWAIISSLILFYVVYKKSNNFWIALFSIIFFASLKSNINLGGILFFTPLTFSIPFIYLYIYFFTEGISQKNKKWILFSLFIMIFLVFTHSISFLFSVPILFIYCLIHLDYIKKEWKIFSLFLLVPLLGISFYSYTNNLPLKSSIPRLIESLQFNKNWGNAERDNSFLEIYSFAGYIVACFGFFYLIKKERKKYFVYLVWPVFLLTSIIIHRIFGVSYFSPYQRNMYYFALSLPILSAFGLNFILLDVEEKIKNLRKLKNKRSYIIFSQIFIVLLIFFLIFFDYYSAPKNFAVSPIITAEDYQTIKFLSTLPKSVIMAKPIISTAIYPVSQQTPLTTLYFYGQDKKGDVELFFSKQTSCEEKQQILKKYNVSYILTKKEINCNWEIIYNKNNYLIYKTE